MSDSGRTSYTSSRKRTRNALRFKDETRRKRSRGSRSPSRSRSYSRNQAVQSERYGRDNRGDLDSQFGEALDPDDEAFYGSGAIDSVEPSLASSYVPDHFTERLFDALADDEGREYWQEIYGQSVDDFVLPHVKDGDEPGQAEMTDDEYAAFVRRGMWERKHGEKLRSTKHQGRENEDDEYRNKGIPSKAANKQGFVEHQRRKMTEVRWRNYLYDWEHLGTAQWTITTVPWPVTSAKADNISKHSVMEFLSNAGNPKALAKEELRRRWHPDRFQQRTRKHVAEAEWLTIFSIVTTTAQILNEIIGD